MSTFDALMSMPLISPRLFDSVLPSVRLSSRPSVPSKVVGTFCAQLVLQFYADSFETLQMFCHGLKICMWFDNILRLFLSLFPQAELSDLRPFYEY